MFIAFSSSGCGKTTKTHKKLKTIQKSLKRTLGSYFVTKSVLLSWFHDWIGMPEKGYVFSLFQNCHCERGILVKFMCEMTIPSTGSHTF